MSDSADLTTTTTTTDGEPRRRITGLSLGLLVGSAVLMVLGAGLFVVGKLTADEPPAPIAAAPDQAEGAPGLPGFAPPSFAEGDNPLAGQWPSGTDGEAAAEAEAPVTGFERWSPAVFRLGFSFFVGFCIAYAVRAFVKVSLVGIGLLLLALFGLQYAGVIDVDWSAMEQHYDTILAWLKTQTATFTAFISGYLPSGAAGGLGLVAGFRRGV